MISWDKSRLKVQIRMFENFYTAMYHSHMAPFLFGDTNGQYRSMNGEIKTRIGNNRYSAYSLWDVFRTWFPMMTLIQPQQVSNWIYDLLSQSEEGGLLPKWSLNSNYTGTMVGYPAVAVIADAMKKGLWIPSQKNCLKPV